MFGKLIGSIVSAPIRIANIPVKIVTKAVHAAGDFIEADPPRRRSTRNVLDDAADAVQDACEEAMGDEQSA